MTISKRNQRLAQRINVALPVSLGQGLGQTKNVSASGICFEVDAAYTLGSEISFVIELETFNEKMLLNCTGRIVRTENNGTKKDVAVQLLESSLAAARQSTLKS